MDGAARKPESAGDEALTAILQELRTLLAPVQQQAEARFTAPGCPVGIVIGPPRSGSTLLLQMLASTGAFAYPTNVLARFAYAPYIGALVQRMLFDPDCDADNSFADLLSKPNFASSLGKSSGALATNEFYHFWRNFMPHYYPEPFLKDELAAIDHAAIARSLASIEAAFGKPFVTKGMMLQFNLSAFFEQMPYSFYIRIRRDPLYVAQSLLEARERVHGSRDQWWSTKPPGYERLSDMDAFYQAAGQVVYTERALETGLQDVPEARQLTVDYPELCVDPAAVYHRIVEKYAALGCELPREYDGPRSFDFADSPRLSKNDLVQLRRALAYFESDPA